MRKFGKDRKQAGPPPGHALSPKEEPVPVWRQVLVVVLGLAAIALIVSPLFLLGRPKGVQGKELSEVLTAVDHGSIDGQAIHWIDINDNSRLVVLNLADGSQVGVLTTDHVTPS